MQEDGENFHQKSKDNPDEEETCPGTHREDKHSLDDENDSQNDQDGVSHSFLQFYIGCSDSVFYGYNGPGSHPWSGTEVTVIIIFPE